MLLSPKVVKEAISQSQLMATRIKAYYSTDKIKSWQDAENTFKITIPPVFASAPFTYRYIDAFCSHWIKSAEERLKASIDSATTETVKIKVNKNVSTFGDITLFPEQQGCYEAIKQSLFMDNIQAAYQDGYTGSGKTIIAASIIADLIKSGVDKRPENLWRLHPYMVFCPKPVAEHWRRTFESFGLSDYLKKRRIYIFTEPEFSTDAGKMFVSEKEDIYTEESSLVWNPILTPLFSIVDEAHHYINIKSHRTKCLEALILTKPYKRFLFMSATPGEKVNDLYLFTLACNTTFFDFHVTKETFKNFAALIDSSAPNKPNRAAMKRARSVLSKHIMSIPYVKPKHKAINLVKLIDFENDKARQIYDTAHQRYLEACAKAGKNTEFGSKFDKFIALNNYRKTVEPLRAPWIAARAAENYYSGKLATAAGCAFKETITDITHILVDKYSIPRDKISIIWGGKKEYKAKDLLTPEELDAIKKHPDPMFLFKDKTLRKKVLLSLRYIQDGFEHNESPEEQAIRHNRLKELKLVGKQSDNSRQDEIDKFQSGETTINLFTIASGGVGLSFDRNKPHLLPREGLFTPVYSGKEVLQLLGRLVRRASLSDAYQYILMMNGTVESSHVAPILDEKLKCIAEITNRTFDMIELLEHQAVQTMTHIRDEQTATKDAENDNTILSDVAAEEDEDTEEENDLEDLEQKFL